MRSATESTTRDGEKPSRGVWRMPATVWALGAVSLFTDVGGEMIYPLLPAFLATMPGAGVLVVGYVEGIAEAFSHLGKPFVGRWSDRLGKRKPFVVVGYAISGAMRPLLGLCGSVLGVALVRSADRLGKSIRSAPRDAMIASSAPRDRQGRAFALQQAMDHVGAVIGPGVAAILIAYGVTASTIFLLAALPGLIALLVAVFFVREHTLAPADAAVESERSRDATPDARISGRIAVSGTLEPASGTQPADPALPRELKAYMVILFVFALGGSTDALLILRGAEMGLSIEGVSAAWLLLHVVKVLGNLPGGALADRVGPVRSILLGWILYALVYAGFAFGNGAAAALTLFGLYGLYYGFAEGAEKMIVARFVTPATRGRAFGVVSLVAGAGALIASIATGTLYQFVGPAVAFGSGAAAALLAALLLAIWGASSLRADSAAPQNPS